MCGRYSLVTEKTDLVRVLDLPADAVLDDLEPRYNVAPTQEVPIVRRDGRRRVALHRWGLVPEWADDRKVGARMINARSETIAVKPAFRDAFRERRCLVPADGFYEWLAVEEGRPKIPHYIRLRSAEPFAFAGLWSEWRAPDGEVLPTFTIVTTRPNELVRPVHDRMPVLLGAEAREAWLAPGPADERKLRDLLRPYDAAEMEMYPVSRWVNSVDHEGERCIRRLDDPEGDFEQLSLGL